MRIAGTLIWSQSRQIAPELSAWWFIGVTNLCVANLATPLHDYIGWLNFSHAAWLLWALGLLPLFEEKCTRGSQFSFPVRTFSLPVRPSHVALSATLARIFMVTLHAVIILGPFLIHNAPMLLLNVVLASIAATLYLQAAAFFMARDAVFLATAKPLALLVPLLLVGYGVTKHFEDSQVRAAVVIAITLLPGVALGIHAARHARYGSLSSVHRYAGGRPGPSTFASCAVLSHLPLSPLWAQAWFEFRATAVWFTGALWFAALPLAVRLALSSGGEAQVTLLLLAGLGLAVAVGLRWERPNRAALQFSLARPMSDTTLGLARLAAALAAVLAGLTGAAVFLGAALSVRAWLGTPVLPDGGIFLFLLALVIAWTPVLWFALTLGRMAWLGVIVLPWVIMLIDYTVSGFGSFFITTTAIFTLLPLTFAGLAHFARKRLNTSANWIWLSGLSFVPVAVLSYFNHENVLLQNLLYYSTGYLFPLTIATASLLFAHSSNALPKAIRNRLFLLLAVAPALPLLVTNIQSQTMSVLYSGGGAYLAAGLILPFVWFPLLARFQRTG